MNFKFQKAVLIIIMIIVNLAYSKGQSLQLSDSAKISLLTNTPWSGAVYALFGHTAIRIEDPINNVDVAFNYGLFDFNSEDFIYRFVKGETDYSVGYTLFERYIIEYQDKGIGITEQILNLNYTEKQNLFDALIYNCLPENRIYRYNYFYDNCTSRARDIIEKNILGKVIYQDNDKLNELTYRNQVHECVSSESWVKFGIDLVIGADADKPINQKQQQFLPAYLMKDFEDAIITNADGTTRKLVLEQKDVLKPINQSTQLIINDYPFYTGIIILIISILVSYMSFLKKQKTVTNIFDSLLFLSAGIAGSIIFFLMFFSIHPCTNPNWNIIWLNPIQLIFAFLFLIKFCSKSVYYYHFINFAVLIVFLLAWFLIPQYLEQAFIPFILAIAIRSGVNVLEYKRSKKVIY